MAKAIWFYGVGTQRMGLPRVEGSCETQQEAVAACERLPEKYEGIARVRRWYHTKSYSSRAVTFRDGRAGRIFVWRNEASITTTGEELQP